jgi:hypothetical protein
VGGAAGRSDHPALSAGVAGRRAYPSTRLIAGSASPGLRTKMILAAGAWAWMMFRTRLNQSVVDSVGGARDPGR